MRRALRVALVLAAGLVPAAGLRAQDPGEAPPVLSPGPAPVISMPGELTPQPTDLTLLSDRPFARFDYTLGPGDQVDISTTGSLNLQYTLMVTPEGRLLIPTVGVVTVLGLNLEEAEARVRGAILQYYRDVEVFLTLTGLRSFKVFVVGDVPNPGPRLASAATRVSELLAGVQVAPTGRVAGPAPASDATTLAERGTDPTALVLAGDDLAPRI
ncbi:MAG: polysaccharide biosynthesis/export family protein, partial [Gemmatimonadota bacterium]